MIYYKSNFINVLLIFTFFSTTMTSPQDDAFENCLLMMKTYCNTYVKDGLSEPTTLHCVKIAIEHWGFNDNLPGKVKEYYFSFHNKLDIGRIPWPKKFCDHYAHKSDIYKRCLSDLEPFGYTKDSAIEHALYFTNLKNYEPKEKEKSRFILADFKKLFDFSDKNVVGVHFGYTYMLRLQADIGASDTKVKQPRVFCHDKCYGEGSSSSGVASDLIKFDED